ncbi:leucine-rich repeat-containing protein 55 isoform X1 [Athene noctua]|uniref:leucine-rich repeat-containing protein 55 isoform X1 n=1 Tax=Athene noctua TaxID=126797 RepID=UPI003EC0D2C4
MAGETWGWILFLLPENGEFLPQQALSRIVPHSTMSFEPPIPATQGWWRQWHRGPTGASVRPRSVGAGGCSREQTPLLGRETPKSGLEGHQPPSTKEIPAFIPKAAPVEPRRILPTLSRLPEKPGGAKPRTWCQHPAQQRCSCGRDPGDTCALPVTPGRAGTALVAGRAVSISQRVLSQPRFGPCLSLPKSRAGSGPNRALGIAGGPPHLIPARHSGTAGRQKEHQKKRQKREKKIQSKPTTPLSGLGGCHPPGRVSHHLGGQSCGQRTAVGLWGPCSPRKGRPVSYLIFLPHPALRGGRV